jgi:transcriptional regulator with XRE-family HTH domain
VTEGQSNPVVARRRLAAAVRRAREEAGLTQEQIASDMDWSPSKLVRIERGLVRISVNDLRALLHRYAIEDGPEVQRYLGWARASRARPWWSEYSGQLPTPSFEALLGMEGEASKIAIFNCTTIPGLLQTEQYAKDLMATYQALFLPPDDADARLEVRLKRLPAVLERQPTLDVVLDEAVLRRATGDRQTMRGQLNRLLEVGSEPGISIYVVPFSAGPYVTSGSFTILSFDGDDADDVVYVEMFDTDTLLDSPHDVTLYQRLFQFTRSKALDAPASAALIRQMADEFA